MLYKFKSRSTADVIMLEPNARQLLQIVGKDPDEHHGIVAVAQIPAAIAALEAAIAAEESGNKANAQPDAEDDSDDEEEGGNAQGSVGLRQRAVPLLDMLTRSAAENNDVVW